MSWRDQIAPAEPSETETPSSGSWRDQVAQKEPYSLASLPSAQRFANLGKESTYEDADFLTRVRAELVDDENLKRQIYADAKGLDVSEIDLEGEESGWLEQGAAGALAHGPSIGLSMAGAAAGGPIGAFVGGAGGEGWRKVLGNMLEGEEQSPEGNFVDMAAEGAFAAGGEVGGRMLGKVIDANVTRRAAKDIGELDGAATEQMQALAKKHGLTLTPGESSGLGSLLNKQWLLSTLPDSGNVIQKFLRRREGDIQKAVFNYFEKLSPAKSPYHGALQGKKSYEAARDAFVQERKDATEALYKSVWDKQVKVSSKATDRLRASLDELAKDGNLSQRSSVNWVKGNIGEGKVTLKRLHNAKVAIDKRLDALRKGTTSADKADKAVLEESKTRILDMIESIEPTYGEARRKFAEMSAPINKLDETIASGFLKADDIKAMGVVKQIFSPSSSPEAVGEAMRIIRHADPGGADAIVRAHLEDAFGRIKDLQVDAPQNLGGQFRKAVFSSDKERSMLKAAMTPEQWKNFDDLMSVLNATSRAFKGQSITVPAGVMKADLEEEAMSAGSRAARVFAASVDTVSNPFQGGKQFLGWISDSYRRFRLGEYSEQLAKAMTDKESMRLLKQQTAILNQPNLKRQDALAAMGAIFGVILGPDVAPRGEDQQSKIPEMQ